MVTKGRNNIKVKKEKMNNDSFYHLIKGENERKKNRKAVHFTFKMLELTLIRNWFLSLVNSHLHEFIVKLPIRLLLF